MRKAATTTDTAQQAATKRTEPAAQLQAQSARHPANWLQLSFDWNVPTAQELWQQRRK